MNFVLFVSIKTVDGPLVGASVVGCTKIIWILRKRHLVVLFWTKNLQYLFGCPQFHPENLNFPPILNWQMIQDSLVSLRWWIFLRELTVLGQNECCPLTSSYSNKIEKFSWMHKLDSRCRIQGHILFSKIEVVTPWVQLS